MSIVGGFDAGRLNEPPASGTAELVEARVARIRLVGV